MSTLSRFIVAASVLMASLALVETAGASGVAVGDNYVRHGKFVHNAPRSFERNDGAGGKYVPRDSASYNLGERGMLVRHGRMVSSVTEPRGPRAQAEQPTKHTFNAPVIVELGGAKYERHGRFLQKVQG